MNDDLLDQEVWLEGYDGFKQGQSFKLLDSRLEQTPPFS